MIKTAMVMAAGHGTRMRPLTNTISKAMVDVGGKPLIDHMLDRLSDAGVERAVVNVHAHADHLEAHLTSRRPSPEIIISDERDELLETGGGVVKALPLLGDDPIFICNIDAVWIEREYHRFPPVKQKPILQQMMDLWRPGWMEDYLLLVKKEDTLGYHGKGDFHRGYDDHIARRIGDSAPYVYAGVQISKLERFRTYPVKKFSRNVVWDKSLRNSTMFGYTGANLFWMHVGDPDAKAQAEKVLADYA